jgi:hypothetical protein
MQPSNFKQKVWIGFACTHGIFFNLLCICAILNLCLCLNFFCKYYYSKIVMLEISVQDSAPQDFVEKCYSNKDYCKTYYKHASNKMRVLDQSAYILHFSYHSNWKSQSQASPWWVMMNHLLFCNNLEQ